MDTPKTLAARPGMKTAPLYHYDDGDAGHRCGTMMCGFCGKPIVDTAFRWRQRNNGDFVTHHRSCTEADPGWAKHDADRLLAPDVGVGLTRYSFDSTTFMGHASAVMGEDPNGEWVRHEDVAAEVAKLNAAGEYYAKEARDWQTIAEVNKDHGEQALAAARAVPAGVEPFGYFCEHRLADPVFLRPPSYIPEPGPNSKVTPLYTAGALAASTARTEAENAEHNRWMEQVIAERDEARAEVAASTAREKAKDEEIAGLREALEWYGSLPKEWLIKSAGLSYGDCHLLGEIARATLSGRKPDTKEGT